MGTTISPASITRENVREFFTVTPETDEYGTKWSRVCLEVPGFAPVEQGRYYDGTGQGNASAEHDCIRVWVTHFDRHSWGCLFHWNGTPYNVAQPILDAVFPEA